MGKLEWIPMESNPQVMNSFLHKVGVKPHIQVVDVFGFDEELLNMIEGQVEGLLLCYPLRGQAQGTVDEDAKEKLYFMRQTIRNACATMALVHLLANRCKDEDFEPNSHLKEFINESSKLEPEDKAGKFENCQGIATAHEEVSNEGQTEAPAPSESVEYHFISLINHDGTIYELDGRKHGPIAHGSTSESNFLKDAIHVVKKFIDVNDSLNFSLQAVTRLSNN